MQADIPSVVIVGHAGSGKTTLCRALVARSGRAALHFSELPAASMLTPNTEDERVVYDTLLGRGVATPDAIVVVVDALQFQQQLYLVSQVIDLRLPVVVALTMRDRAARLGSAIEHTQLGGLLGVDVIPVHPEQGEGVDDLKRAVEQALGADPAGRQLHWRPSMGLADAYNHLDQSWVHKHLHLHTGARLIEGLRLISSPRAVEDYLAHPAHGALVRTLEEVRSRLEARKENWTLTEVLQRHNWAAQVAGQVVTKVVPDRLSDRLMLRFRRAPAWMGWASIGLAAVLMAFVALYFLQR
ncbi:MAG: FeoB small GTPase domain-containing protein [Rhodothermales bacterium]